MLLVQRSLEPPSPTNISASLKHRNVAFQQEIIHRKQMEAASPLLLGTCVLICVCPLHHTLSLVVPLLCHIQASSQVHRAFLIFSSKPSSQLSGCSNIFLLLHPNTSHYTMTVARILTVTCEALRWDPYHLPLSLPSILLGLVHS